MKSKQIQEAISNLFIAVDNRDWDRVTDIFYNTVLLDYTSMAGGEPSNLTPEQIIDSWKSILPGFDCTHHQLGNFIINADLETASAFCYGTATHFLKNDTGNNVWTVVGSYNFELKLTCTQWKVTQMKFNFKYMDGNGELAALAQKNVSRV